MSALDTVFWVGLVVLLGGAAVSGWMLGRRWERAFPKGRS